jgi:hypothetical protein
MIPYIVSWLKIVKYMSKIEKTLKKWRKSKQPAPKGKVVAVLDKYFVGNYEFKGGSHIVVRHPLLEGIPDYGAKGEFVIAVESGQRVKPVYLKTLVKVIDYLYETEAIKEKERENE